MSKEFEIFPIGDHGITLRCGRAADLAVNGKMAAMADWLRTQHIAGIRDIIPVYNSVTIIYNVSEISRTLPETPKAYISGWLKKAWEGVEPKPRTDRPVIQIPVCYDDSYALNKQYVVRHTGLEWKEIVELHTSKTYQVCMLGFLPGFPYLGLLPEVLTVPRKETPRTPVPAGSITICDRQTGIFPFTHRGGWAVIGRTPENFFDASADNPALLKVGDQVRFYSITVEEFRERSEKSSDL